MIRLHNSLIMFIAGDSMFLPKIAIVTPALPFGTSRIGGAETYVEKLSMELAKLGCHVAVFTGSKSNLINSKNLEIINLKTFNRPHFIFKRCGRFSPDLLFRLKKVEADIIHVHHLRTPLLVTAAIFSKLRKIPLVLTDHGGGGLPFPKIMAQFPAAFITVSKYSAKNLLRYAPQKKAFIVYAGVDINHFNPNVKSGQLRKNLNLKSDVHVILFVGRVMPHKGVDVLLRAISIVKKKLPRKSVVVLVVGPFFDHKYLKYLQSVILKLNLSSDVIFCGAVSEGELPMYYSLCDLVVVPSVHRDCFGKYHPHPELLSITSLEAMACGKPVIASNIGGIPEIVQNYKTGLLINPGDACELADAIRSLVEDEAFRLQMGKNAFDFVQKHFTWRRVAHRTVSAYNIILNSGGHIIDF